MQTTTSTQAILRSVNFQRLTVARSRLRWIFSLVISALFIGFVLLICFAKQLLGTTLGSSIFPLGFAIAFWLGIVSLAITGVYVYIANATFTPLTKRLQDEVAS